jgi:hypothetical protein
MLGKSETAVGFFRSFLKVSQGKLFIQAMHAPIYYLLAAIAAFFYFCKKYNHLKHFSGFNAEIFYKIGINYIIKPEKGSYGRHYAIKAACLPNLQKVSVFYMRSFNAKTCGNHRKIEQLFYSHPKMQCLSFSILVSQFQAIIGGRESASCTSPRCSSIKQYFHWQKLAG